MLTSDDYQQLFRTPAEAAEFEEAALFDADALPEPAQEVWSGGEPTSEYWQWLIELAKEMK